MLRDLKGNPARIVKLLSNFITHNICLIDLKSLSSFETEKISRILSTSKTIINIALTSKHLVLENIEVLPSQSTMEKVILGVFEERLENIFDS